MFSLLVDTSGPLIFREHFPISLDPSLKIINVTEDCANGDYLPNPYFTFLPVGNWVQARDEDKGGKVSSISLPLPLLNRIYHSMSVQIHAQCAI